MRAGRMLLAKSPQIGSETERVAHKKESKFPEIRGLGLGVRV